MGFLLQNASEPPLPCWKPVMDHIRVGTGGILGVIPGCNFRGIPLQYHLNLTFCKLELREFFGVITLQFPQFPGDQPADPRR